MADSPAPQQPKRTARLKEQYKRAVQEGRINSPDLRGGLFRWLRMSATRREDTARSNPIRRMPKTPGYQTDIVSQYQGLVSEREIARHAFMRCLLYARYMRLEWQAKGYISPLP